MTLFLKRTAITRGIWAYHVLREHQGAAATRPERRSRKRQLTTTVLFRCPISSVRCTNRLDVSMIVSALRTAGDFFQEMPVALGIGWLFQQQLNSLRAGLSQIPSTTVVRMLLEWAGFRPAPGNAP